VGGWTVLGELTFQRGVVRLKVMAKEGKEEKSSPGALERRRQEVELLK